MHATVHDIVVVSLKQNGDSRGELTVIEFPTVVGFDVVRIFYISKVAIDTQRGAHGHKRCTQFMVCQAGRIEFELYDGLNERLVELRAGQAMSVPPGIFVTIRFKELDSTLLVLCDRPYEAEDYLQNQESLRQFRLEHQI